MKLSGMENKDKGGRMSDLKQRTKLFALSIIRLYSQMPKTIEAQIIGKQFLRSGTSVGAHYREASRARSDAEFISKIEGGLQELEETLYWFELVEEGNILKDETRRMKDETRRMKDEGGRMKDEIGKLKNEANELIAILVTCVKNVKSR